MTDIPVSKPVNFAASPFCAELAVKELAKSKAPPVEFAKLEFGPQAIPGMIGGPKGGPAVIVLQEWWGLTPQVLAHAAILAAAGFRVLVPDLYKGKIGVSAEEAHHLMGDLDFPGAVREIGQAAAHLKGEGAPAVGIIGFCMGGALSLGAAAKSADIACAVSCYGVNFDLFAPAELAAKPVQGHYGANDKMSGFSDLLTARKLQAVLREAGNEGVEVFEYNRSGHAFLNDDPSPFASFEQRQATMGTPAFDNEEAAAAWERILGFFRAHLGAENEFAQQHHVGQAAWHDTEKALQCTPLPPPPLPPAPPVLPPPSGRALKVVRLHFLSLLLLFAASSIGSFVLGCLWAQHAGSRGWAAAMFVLLCGSALINGGLALIWGEVEALPASPPAALATVLLGATLWLSRGVAARPERLHPASRLAALACLAEGSFRGAPVVYALVLAESAAVPQPLPALHLLVGLLALATCLAGLVPSLGGAPHDEARAPPPRTRRETVGALVLVPAAIAARALALGLSRAVGGEGGACACALAAVCAAAGARAAMRVCGVPRNEVCMAGMGEVAFALLEAFALALCPQSYPVAAGALTRIAAELGVAAICLLSAAIALGASAGPGWRQAQPDEGTAVLSLSNRTGTDASRRLLLALAICACAVLQVAGATLLFLRRARAELAQVRALRERSLSVEKPADEGLVRTGSFHSLH